MDDETSDPHEVPIDGVLDLHAFAPRDARSVVGEYLDACRGRGILDVRIIHGKGTGALRRTIHAVLSARPDVERFASADESGGGWGATVVRLRAGGG